jgi:2-dehydro-3-deoxyglucarate aldolase/4-hydroxy-2-oxoheptanedioate aldolase
MEKIKAIHERTLVICMIETRAGLENVDAIAAVPGVDVLWLGHFDLTNFLGIPAQFSHPLYRAAVKRIVDAARKHGKAAGYMAADEGLGREYLGHGYRMIATGTDQGLLQNATAKLISAWKSPSA